MKVGSRTSAQVSSKQVEDAHSVNLSFSLQGGWGRMSSSLLPDETSKVIMKGNTGMVLMILLMNGMISEI